MQKIKKRICKPVALLTLALFCTINSVKAQERQGMDNFGFGIQLSQYQNDFGAGINITSPYFANRKIAVRLRGNFMFHEHIQNGETTWTPYSNVSVGLAGVSGNIGDHIRLYGEGGLAGLFPSSEFSSEKFEFGGYGHFGFEFFMSEKHNYFIEIGGIGTGAKADRVENSPIYSNGFLINTGFRMHF